MADLYKVLKNIADSQQGKISFSEIIYAKLTSINPVTFIPEDREGEEGLKKIIIKEDFLVIPKYRVFTEEEIGNKFVLQKNFRGQTYFYLYEASEPQGQNGLEYKWKGRIEKCELIGTCPHGSVVVTHGKIEKGVHEKGIEKK